MTAIRPVSPPDPRGGHLRRAVPKRLRTMSRPIPVRAPCRRTSLVVVGYERLATPSPPCEPRGPLDRASPARPAPSPGLPADPGLGLLLARLWRSAAACCCAAACAGAPAPRPARPPPACGPASRGRSRGRSPGRTCAISADARRPAASDFGRRSAPSATAGARIRVQATGVGAPSGSITVTIASPMPSCCSVSARS